MKVSALSAVLVLVFVASVVAVSNPPILMTLGQVYQGNVGLNKPLVYQLNIPVADGQDFTEEVSVTAYALYTGSAASANVSFVQLKFSNVSTTDGPFLSTTTFPQESFVIPQLPEDENTSGYAKAYISVWVYQYGPTSPDVVTFTISADVIQDLLNSNFLKGDGIYEVSKTISAGQRPYFSLNDIPAGSPYHVQVEQCNSNDLSGDAQTVNAALLWNIFTDLSEDDYGVPEFGCGLDEIHGNILFTDPQDAYAYQFVCPTIITATSTSTALGAILIGVDVMEFWMYPVLNATVTFKITVWTDPKYYISPALEAAPAPNPIWIAYAPIGTLQQGNDLVVNFTIATASTKVEYAFFSDYKYQAVERNAIRTNNSLANPCFLTSRKDDMMIGDWVDRDALKVDQNGVATFTLKDYFKQGASVDGVEYSFNIVAQDETGQWAYSYVTLPSTDAVPSDSGLSGGVITLIVLGCLLGVAILAIAVVVGVIFVLRWRKKTDYDIVG